MGRVAHDPGNAQLPTGSFMDHAMPRARDLPCCDRALLHTATMLNPLGVAHLDMPATAARVWQAIRDAAGPCSDPDLSSPSPFRR